MYITLSPAYGADYRTKKEVLEAWNAGKDFIVETFGAPFEGKPMNKEQVEKGHKYSIRYKKLTQTCKVEA